MDEATKTATLALFEDAIKHARANLSAARQHKRSFESLPENNVYDTLEDAEAWIEERLHEYASADCDGRHKQGQQAYYQPFSVGDKAYMAKLEPEYNRHDKTYYYVDGAEFTVEEVPAAAEQP